MRVPPHSGTCVWCCWGGDRDLMRGDACIYRSTLCNPEVVEYINSNFVVWGGTVTSTDGYDTMGLCQVSSFPHVAIYVPSRQNRRSYQKLWSHEGSCASSNWLLHSWALVHDETHV